MEAGDVVLIFKKGKKEDPGNYRPSKIMEKIVLGGPGTHLEDNAVMGHSQHRSMRESPACGTQFPSTPAG